MDILKEKIDSLRDDIVKALTDIEKAELLLKTYEKWEPEEMYIEMAQDCVIASKSKIIEVLSVL